MKTCALLLAALLLSLPALAADLAADLAGRYVITGYDGGDERIPENRYTGEGELTRHGDGWRFAGQVDGVAYRAAGLFDEAAGILSLGYVSASGRDGGVTVLRLEGETLSGPFLSLDSPGPAGFETWRKAE